MADRGVDCYILEFVAFAALIIVAFCMVRVKITEFNRTQESREVISLMILHRFCICVYYDLFINLSWLRHLCCTNEVNLGRINLNVILRIHLCSTLDHLTLFNRL